MFSKPYYLLAGLVLAVGLYVALPGREGSADPAGRRAALADVELPADGLALYRTLLREIPEVVSQVPCACCNQKLATCYQGYCPPT